MTLKHAFLGVMATSLLVFGCDVDRSSAPDPAGYYFTGTVYDGLKGEPLTDKFEVSLEQASETLEGDVDEKTGTFSIGPLKPGSDYVITISADGYRKFFAVEPLKANLPTTVDKQVTQYYEAYLFPEDLKSPEVTLELYGQDSQNNRPSGQVRFAPAAEGTSVLNLTSQAGSVTGQVWANDADRKVGTVMLEAKDGTVEIKEGALVYGVTYTGVVFDVGGHGYKAFNFTAGTSGHQTILLDNLADEPLLLLSNSLDTGDYSDDGTVTYMFNQSIEFSPATPDYVVAELIDDRITISGTNDANDNNISNVLIGDSATTTAIDDPNKQERGTEISIDGNTLTISWPGYKKASSYEPNMFDLEDLRSVTYDVSSIRVRREGATDLESVTLQSLIAATSGRVTVQLKEPLTP
jgi:hypothetical protein